MAPHSSTHSGKTYTSLVASFFSRVPGLGTLFESPVQSTKAWRDQDKAEAGAGFTSPRDHIVIAFFTCDLCGIGIGPRHYEREVYYLPILEKMEILGEDPWLPERKTQVTAKALHICGGCAKHRLLPESYLLFPEQLWTLASQEISKQIQQIDRFLKWMDQVLLITWLAFHGLRLAPDVTPEVPALAPKKAPVMAARRTLSSLSLSSSPHSKSAHPLAALMSLPTPNSSFILA